MATTSFCQLSVVARVEAEDALLELLGQRFAWAPCAYLAAGSAGTTVSLFLEHPPDKTTLEALRSALDSLAERCPGFGRATIRRRQIRAEDWAESWKRHFKPLFVGGCLVIRPGWARVPKRPGQRVVVLDPGLSFGTGHHPTTRFCLRQSVIHRPRGGTRSFVDLGTGSGILAIAAAKLGYAPVRAIDNDADALRVARNNARRNRVVEKIRFQQLDVRSLTPAARAGFDLVTANLTSDLLIGRSRAIGALVRPGGTLVLAGILAREFPRVAAVFGAGGFRLSVRSSQREWASGAFQRVAGPQANPGLQAPYLARGNGKCF